jgi:RNA polymerase sigma-70 factor (ECF subfamily)
MKSTAGLDAPTDEAEFTALYRREYPSIARYLLRRGAGDLTADLAAEIFVVAWRQRGVWHQLPQDQRLAWLYGVARKVLANARRSSRRAGELAGRLARLDHTQLTGDGSGATVEFVALAAAFAQLPEADQELIRLVAWEELSLAQVAAVLGCRVGTATMRLHRARTKLRRLTEGKGKS